MRRIMDIKRDLKFAKFAARRHREAVGDDMGCDYSADRQRELEWEVTGLEIELQEARSSRKSLTADDYTLWLYPSYPDPGPHQHIAPGMVCYRALRISKDGKPSSGSLQLESRRDSLPSYCWGQGCLVCPNMITAQKEMEAAFPQTFAGWVE